MDGGPHRIIRLVQLGMWREALESQTIWLCVGCNTCATQCPNAIDVAAIADTLRIMAIERKVVVPESGVLAFHKAVLDTIRRYGRTHKLEIMLRYKLKKFDFLTDTGIGLKLFAKRKLDLLPSKVARIADIQRLFHENNLS
jgi:heterodisulfide reductase subunit C